MSKVTIKATNRYGPAVHKRVEASELSEYEDWEVVHRDDETDETDEESRVEELAATAAKAWEARSDLDQGSDVWEGIAADVREEHNVNSDDEEKPELHIQDDESWDEYRERLKYLEVERDPQEEKEKEKEAIRVGGNSPRRSSALADMMQDRADDLLGEGGDDDVSPGVEGEELADTDIPDEKREAAVSAFRERSSDEMGSNAWDDIADDLEAEELSQSQSVDSTTIESIPGGTFMKSDTGEKTTAEIRTTDEEIKEEIRKQDHLSLRIVEDQDERMVAKSDDFEELQEQVKNL